MMGETATTPSDRLVLAVTRHEVLATIDEHDDATIADLTDRLEYTRSHTNRIVNRLCEAGFLERHSRDDAFAYGLTALGTHVLDWIDTGHDLLAAAPFFEAMPPDRSLPHWLVQSGNITVASGVTSYRVIEPVLAYLDRIDRFRVAVPALTRQEGFDLASDRALSGDLAIEMCLTESFFDDFVESSADRLQRLVTDAEVTVYTISDALPYGFGIGYHGDEPAEISVVGYDEAYTGINGVLIDDTERAVEWAQDRFRQYLTDAVDRTDDIRRGIA